GKPQRLPLDQGLSTSAVPNPVSATRRVRVSGRLVGIRRGVRRCGVAITLWRRFPGQRHYGVVARTRTTAGGRYSFVFPAGALTTNRDWFTTARGLRSRALAEHVSPLVTLSTTATFAVA